MTDAFRYEVRYGYCNMTKVAFADFYLALAFLRGLYAGQAQGRDVWRNHPSLVNVTNIDGADDAKPWAQLGLTEDEWEQIESL